MKQIIAAILIASVAVQPLLADEGEESTSEVDVYDQAEANPAQESETTEAPVGEVAVQSGMIGLKPALIGGAIATAAIIIAVTAGDNHGHHHHHHHHHHHAR